MYIPFSSFNFESILKIVLYNLVLKFKHVLEVYNTYKSLFITNRNDVLLKIVQNSF